MMKFRYNGKELALGRRNGKELVAVRRNGSIVWPGYSFSLVPVSAEELLPASGGTVRVSALLRTYRNDELLSTQEVVPTLSGSATGFSISGDVVTAANRTTVTGAARSLTVTLAYTFTHLGESHTLSAQIVIFQSANTSTIGAITLSGGAVSDIPAGGGTVSAMTGLSAAQSVTFSSGATRAGAVSVSYSAAVSASSLGLTEKVRTKIGTLTATATGEGSKTASKTLDVYQAANVRSLMGCYIVDDNSGTTSVPASGKTIALAPRAVYGYTAGVSQDVDVSTAAEFVGRSIWSLADGNAYTTLTTPSGRNTATIAVAGRGTNVGAARMVSVVLTLPAGSENRVGNTAYQQAANSASYGVVTISGGTAADIPAGGGTVSAASGVSASQSVTFTSGASRAGAVSIGFSAPVSAPSLSTTAKARTKAGTLTATATGEGGKTAAKTIDVYQAANAIESYKNLDADLWYDEAYPYPCGIIPNMSVQADAVYTSGSIAAMSVTPSGVVYTKNGPFDWFVVTQGGGVDVANNATPEARTATDGVRAVVSFASLTKEVYTTISQKMGVRVWEDIQIEEIAASLIPASGGRASDCVGFKVRQRYTWNGQQASQAEVVCTRAQLAQFGYAASFANDVTAPSLGTTPKVQTKVASVVVSVARTPVSGAAATVTVSVSQTANMIETYAAPVVTLGEVDLIPASGGATPRIAATYSQQATYTSGAKVSITSGAAVTVPVPVTVSTKGTTISDVTYFGDCVLRVALNGKSTDTLVPLYQAGNYVIGADLHSIYARYRVVSPAGETISPATGSTTTFRFTSGATLDATPSGGTRITTKQLYTLAADAAKPWVKSLDAATGALTLDGMGVLEGERDTPAITRTLQVKFIHDSGFTPPERTVFSNEATGTSVCTQGTNRIERYEALSVAVNYGQAQEGIIGAIPETDVSATAVFTSGAKKSVDVKAATTIVYSKNTSDDWFSVTPGGGVNFTNNTSTEERTAQNGVRAVATAVLLGKTLTATTYATVTQAAGRQVFGQMEISGFGVEVPASGGLSSAYAVFTVSHPWTWNGVEGLGGTLQFTGASVPAAYTVSYSATYTGQNLGMTTKARTALGATTLTISRTPVGSSPNGSATCTVYQAANTRRYENFKAELYYGVAPYTACGLVPNLRTKIDEVYTSGAVRQSDADSYVIRKTYTKNSADAWFRIQTANGAIDIDANPSDYPRASGEGIKVVLAASCAGVEHNATAYGTVQQNGRKTALNSLDPQDQAQATNEIPSDL